MRILSAAVLFVVAASYLQAVDYVVNVPGDVSMNAFGDFSGSSGDLRGVLSQIDVDGGTATYNTTFSLSYQGEFGSGYRSNAVLVKFGKLF